MNPEKSRAGREKTGRPGPRADARIVDTGSYKQTFEVADLDRLGRIIRWLRTKRPKVPRMAQGELAAKMSADLEHSNAIDQATISRIEGGDRAMSYPTFQALCKALDIPGQCLVMLAVRDWGTNEETAKQGRMLQSTIAREYFAVDLEKLESELEDL